MKNDGVRLIRYEKKIRESMPQKPGKNLLCQALSPFIIAGSTPNSKQTILGSLMETGDGRKKCRRVVGGKAAEIKTGTRCADFLHTVMLPSKSSKNASFDRGWPSLL